MSVEPVKAYVKPHGLVMQPYRDADFYDLERDDWLCPTVWDEDAPTRSTRRGAQTRSVTPAAPPAGTGHAPGDPSSPPGAVVDPTTYESRRSDTCDGS